jgi:hypothetical protein
MHGGGAIELLAREMTLELHGIRKRAVERARQEGQTVRVPLVTKGISFGFVTALADGTLQLNEVQGVDRDMVVRPWGQKGTVTSLRTFSVNATNLHHGMQARERFGVHLTGSVDFDRDGIKDELTEGDITALAVFQASLGVPGRVLPRAPEGREKVARGERLFAASQCAQCHVPALPLDGSVLTEPGPFNLEGTLRAHEVQRPFQLDLTRDTEAPRLERDSSGRLWVRAFTDLKRHRISDAETPHFGNETLVEGLAPTDEFITRRLWAAGNTAPYGHRGDLLTLREAILAHGGEARAARKEFEALPPDDQGAIIVFLRTLQILPAGSPNVVMEPAPPVLPYREP